MALGFFLMDVLYFAGLISLISLSTQVAFMTYVAVMGASIDVPFAFAVALSFMSAVLAWIAAVVLLSSLLPKLRAGRYKNMAHPMFYNWTLSFLLRRFLSVPPIHMIVYQSNVLRFICLRLLGARIHFTTNMSSDVLLLDPAMFTGGKNCTIGSGAIVASHLVLEGRLLLAEVRLGDNVEIGSRCMIGPGVEIGSGTRVGVCVTMAPKVVIGEDAIIGAHSLIDQGVRVGKGARVLGDLYVPPGTEIEDGAVFAG